VQLASLSESKETVRQYPIFPKRGRVQIARLGVAKERIERRLDRDGFLDWLFGTFEIAFDLLGGLPPSRLR
jgi:hypothetical protein